MTIFKCKMCGGSLEINNETVATCEYCGTMQTIPRLTDDKRSNLYDRANHFRRNNEYDKATGIYEQILAEDTSDSEAYWSLVLCKYGIEYVEDPKTHKRMPTVNRVQLTSILDDENYKCALKYSDTEQKKVYEEEAKVINKIQKNILEISEREEPYDVFICYKESDDKGQRTNDSVMAQDIYTQLEQEGLNVFFARISLEDKLGSAYEPYIFAALNSAKVMLVVGTKPEHFNAVWVKNEWSRYLIHVNEGENKTLIPVYAEMDPYDLPVEFSHLQAQDMSKIGFMQDLVRGVKKLVSEDKSVSKKVVLDDINLKLKKQARRNKLTVVITVLVVVLAVAGVFSYIYLLSPYLKYKSACKALEEGRYWEAHSAFSEMEYRDSADKKMEALYYFQMEGITKASKGAIVTFGVYEQDGNAYTTDEEIKWVVLAVEQNKVLLGSLSILDNKPFNNEFKSVSWQTSDLRMWLNNEFFNTAFSEYHQKSIIDYEIRSLLTPNSLEEQMNADVFSEIICYDKVFIDGNNVELGGVENISASNYAISNGASDGFFWTRKTYNNMESDNKYCLYINGRLNRYGTNVNLRSGVRPIICISLE